VIVAAGHHDRGDGPVPRRVTDRDAQRERGNQPERVVDARSLDGPVERGAEVVDLGCDDLDPSELVSTAEVGTRGLGQLDAMVGVAAPEATVVASAWSRSCAYWRMLSNNR